MTEAKRSALVVASYEYQDARLRQLRAPARDAEELARVLSDESIGDFDVEVSVNEPEHVVRRKLAGFFQNRGLDDVLLLHLSCHGVKDDDGHLYFATADTEVSNLDATSIPSEFVNRQMTRSRSRRIVLHLARSSMVPEERPVELPAELQSAAESPFAQVRLGACRARGGARGRGSSGCRVRAGTRG